MNKTDNYLDKHRIGEISDNYLHTEYGWRIFGLNILNRWYGFFRARRLKKFSLLEIICCPECHGDLESKGDSLNCINCNSVFSNKTIPDFTKVNKMVK